MEEHGGISMFVNHPGRLVGKLADPVRHLYVHVPFCVRKCPYCAFYSIPVSGPLVDRYVAMLLREIEMAAPELNPETIYFGGGTPSLLSAGHFSALARLFERLGWTQIREWTVEANPATLSLEKAKLLRELGVNRISLGIQSFNADVLRQLQRIHGPDDALQAFELLREAGFENINIDLIFGVPGQSLRVWTEDLAKALALRSEHLSAYELSYEEDTVFFERFTRGEFGSQEDLLCEMYDALVDLAGADGLVQYEVSNFAREGTVSGRRWPMFACEHNIAYWRGKSYYGAGPSAVSYIQGVHIANVRDVGKYCSMLEQGFKPVASAERLSSLARAGQTAAFGLRMLCGWLFSEFQSVTGFDLRKEWGREISSLVDEGLAVFDDAGLRLTRKGTRFADLVAERFLR